MHHHFLIISMKRIITILIFFGLLVSSVVSQQNHSSETDSIIAILPQLKGTEKLEALRKITNLTYDEPVRKHYVNMMLNEARLQRNIDYEGRALAILVEIYYSYFDNDSIFIIGEEALQFTRKNNLYNYFFTIKQIIIQRKTHQGQLFTALNMAKDAYNTAKDLQEYMYIARMLAAMGNIYHELNQFETAVNCYEESLELAKIQRNPNSYLYIENYNHLANIAAKQKRFDEVLRYADSMRVELKRIGSDPVFNFLTEYHHIVAYSAFNREDEVKEAIKRAEEIYNPYWDGSFFEILLNEMYYSYYSTTKNWDKASEYNNKALRFIENNQLDITDVLKNKALIHSKKGDFETAYNTMFDLLNLKDSLNHEQFYSQINELYTIYELDKIELEAQRRLTLIQRLQLTVTIFIISSVALLLLVVLVLWNRRRIAEKNRGLYRQIKEQDYLENQLKQAKDELNLLKKKQNYEPQNDLEEPTMEKQQKLVADMNEYLIENRNFAQTDMNYDKIVTALATNKTYLFEAVKTISGKTPLEYINDMRIEETRRKLDNEPELTINVIADECGLNIRTFNRLFQKRYGMSPSEYRKSMVNG